MRRAARVDQNHAYVAGYLRDLGAHVLDVHAIPGALDLLVAYRGRLVLLEVKDGNKPASRRAATEAERTTLREVLHRQAPAWIVETEYEASVMIGAVEDARTRAAVEERTHKAAARPARTVAVLEEVTT